jgi:hypothetical protein
MAVFDNIPGEKDTEREAKMQEGEHMRVTTMIKMRLIHGEFCATNNACTQNVVPSDPVLFPQPFSGILVGTSYKHCMIPSREKALTRGTLMSASSPSGRSVVTITTTPRGNHTRSSSPNCTASSPSPCVSLFWIPLRRCCLRWP